jgi:hypothetical protein
MQFKARIIISSILYLCVKKQQYLHPQDHTRDDGSNVRLQQQLSCSFELISCTFSAKKQCFSLVTNQYQPFFHPTE